MGIVGNSRSGSATMNDRESAESAEPLLLRLLWPKLRAAQRRSAAADEAQLGGPSAGATVA